MAKPRVFLSSTYFDLKQIRADLEKFIKDQGYDPVLNEQGNIPYGKDDRLEDYCYKEINNVDILVSIIGGRYGSESRSIENSSISQAELKTAFDQNKQVYIFIEKNVYSEYRFYLNNKNNDSINFTHADSVKIHQFIEFVESLPNNNTIHGFDTSNEIIRFLKEQWAGLFHRFLREQTRVKEINTIKGLENTAKTLNQLVTFLTEEKRGKDHTISEILLSNHPAMEQLKEELNIPFRIYFTTKEELIDLIKALGFKISVDYLPFDVEEEWLRERDGGEYKLTLNNSIFTGDNKLKVFTKSDWQPEWLSVNIVVNEPDDLPF